ncbi:chemotaxis protein CheD [Geomonas sp. Red32]|uniref:chemotaxis protein CheD n=1 Tax=Geomonas sp. Red32 TaxID=2912856 RepID=UPI00202CC5A8|nr:chemotaxis protein CheD [Geomonas sp. Red32]MCM0081354.1 chemotaxis protein CheD [Geomonas sp. Red32]
MTGDGRTATVYLKPGGLVIASKPTMVTTLLGSCVAVTLYCPRLRMGAICHAVLPACRRSPCLECQLEGSKYVLCAVRLMLRHLAERGVNRSEIQAKLFGGAEMFTCRGKNGSVGQQNAELALRLLQDEGIRLVSHDFGGERGRKLVFDTDSGEVYLKKLRKSEH